MKGKVVVVAVDGSPASDAAVEAALDLADALGSSVHLVHSASPLAEDVYKQRDDQFGGPTQAEFVAHDDLLAAAAGRASQAGVEYKVQLISFSGNADLAASIAGMAAGLEAGLIVTGSRGHGAFVGSVLGSLSQNLIKFATMPVVIVNASTDE